MATWEHRSEKFFITADNADQAMRRLASHLSDRSSEADSVFDDKDAAERSAANAERFMHLTGTKVFVAELTVETA